MNKKCINIPKSDCSGCGSCVNICPTSAISMVPDENGFLYPRIKGSCIDCGLCYLKCPIIFNQTHPNQNVEPIHCFAFESKDPEIVLKSSSGGAFSTLADYVFSKGGVVCGVEYDYEEKKAQHVVVTNKEDFAKLRTSKYVQSDTKYVYRELKEFLEKGTLVLFTGCGCQVSAFKAFLNKGYPNLILVDIVCHGVPSKLLLDKYLDYIGNHEDCTKINFREKKQYGWTPTMNAYFADGKEYYRPKWESEYYSIFLKGIGCRLSCGHCFYNKLPRQGDLTVGDFWGINEYDPKFKDTKGASIILFNNDKHEELVDMFRENAHLFEEEDINLERKINGNIFGSSATDRRRERFFNLLRKYDFKEAHDRLMKRHFEIGIVGWWYGKNYGSFLTYYALNRYLIKEGYDVLMLSWPYHSKPFPKKPDHWVHRAANEFYEFSIDRTFAEYPDLNNYVDVFMIGSDQMWNYWDKRDTGYYYFLDFVRDGHPRLSYSTSFGHKTYMAPPEDVARQKELLHKFTAVSVREFDGVDICKKHFGIEATRTIDPVFLADKKEYELLLQKNPVQEEKKYLFCYILTPTKEKGEILKKIAASLGLELIVALDGQTPIEKNRKQLGIEKVEMNLDVSRWLSFIKNAEFVVTDSFHGICFSIIFKKEFACMVNQKRGTSRFDTLFKVLHLENRAFNELDELLKSDFHSKIDYAAVDKALKEEVDFSKKWFKDALDKAFDEYRKKK